MNQVSQQSGDREIKPFNVICLVFVVAILTGITAWEYAKAKFVNQNSAPTIEQLKKAPAVQPKKVMV